MAPEKPIHLSLEEVSQLQDVRKLIVQPVLPLGA